MENTTNNEQPKKRIKVNPAPFNPAIEVAVTTTTEFCIKLNDIFSAVFDDFLGTYIECGPTEHPVTLADGSMTKALTYDIKNTMLQFRVLTKDEYDANKGLKAFAPIGSAIKPAGLIDRVTGLMARTSKIGPRVEMTEEGKQMLAEFMLTLPNGKINWANCFYVAQTNTDTRIILKNLDLAKLIKKIYGAKDENDSDLYYEYMITAPVSSGYREDPNYSIRITRYNLDNVSESEREMGIRYYQIPTVPGINVITKKTADPSK